MSKLASLSEAVSSIPPGSHISLSGFAITRCAMAFAREVIRQGLKGLTLSQCVGAMDADLLVGAGAVKRLIYGGGSLDRFGRLANVNRGIEDGTLKADEYSSLSVAFRYLAGSLGLPFIPIRSLRGSDLMKQLEEKSSGDVADVDDPFSGKSWKVLRPLNPDVAVVQVQSADEEGNAWIMGPRWDNVEQAKSAKRTILIAENILSNKSVRQNPERTVIPGLFVSHVVELPFGAHPTSVYREYDYDSKAIEEYVEASKTPEVFRTYLEKTVFGVKDHAAYLDLMGGKNTLRKLKADPVLGY
ncbi:MAG: CoA transferase subunit A [Anaerolineaceae bacterium]|nr:CoA transferase subunit A [Anaerolineaceae bacterium]